MHATIISLHETFTRSEKKKLGYIYIYVKPLVHYYFASTYTITKWTCIENQDRLKKGSILLHPNLHVGCHWNTQ